MHNSLYKNIDNDTLRRELCYNHIVKYLTIQSPKGVSAL